MTNEDSAAHGPGPNELFGHKVKRERLARGWSVPDFAERLNRASLKNFHPTTVSRMESGERPTRIFEAATIANVLGRDLASLLEGLSSPTTEFISTHEFAEGLLSEAANLLASMLYNFAHAATVAGRFPHVLEVVKFRGGGQFQFKAARSMDGRSPDDYLEHVRTYLQAAVIEDEHDWDAVDSRPEAKERLRQVGYSLVDAVIRSTEGPIFQVDSQGDHG